MSYRISLILTIVLTVIAFVTLLGWVGAMVRGAGYFPWLTLALILATAINCSYRARRILHRQ